MDLKGLIAFGFIIVFSSCFKQKTTISALVESDSEGSCIVKWEIYPESDESVIEIYASDNDSVFPLLPIKKVEVNKYIDVVEDADSLGYRYFKLKVGDTFSNVIAKRFYQFDNVQNFRDIGGYVTNDGKTVKWGKVFRSGEFSNMTLRDVDEFNALNIKSVIDFRPKRLQQARKDVVDVTNHYSLFVTGTSSDSISKRVLENRFLRGDALIYMQDMYEQMFIDYCDEYARFFDYLIDEDNYPIIYHCVLGKDQSGIATYFLLKALDVPITTIEDDYMLSNIGVNKRKIIKDASELPELQQQVFTMLTRTDIAFLRYGVGCIKKEEGSVDEFMLKCLGLTSEKKKKLREILLYQEQQ